jgi:hypothetical protein
MRHSVLDGQPSLSGGSLVVRCPAVLLLRQVPRTPATYYNWQGGTTAAGPSHLRHGAAGRVAPLLWASRCCCAGPCPRPSQVGVAKVQQRPHDVLAAEHAHHLAAGDHRQAGVLQQRSRRKSGQRHPVQAQAGAPPPVQAQAGEPPPVQAQAGAPPPVQAQAGAPPPARPAARHCTTTATASQLPPPTFFSSMSSAASGKLQPGSTTARCSLLMAWPTVCASTLATSA